MFYHQQEAAGQRHKPQEQDRTANLKNLPCSRCCGSSLVVWSVVLGAHVERKGWHSGMSPSETATENPHPGAAAQRIKTSSELYFAILIATPEQSNRDK